MKKSLVLLITFTASQFIFAWPGGASSGPGFKSEINDTPVDGGIVTVTALAIGYGVRQARKRREDKNS